MITDTFGLLEVEIPGKLREYLVPGTPYGPCYMQYILLLLHTSEWHVVRTTLRGDVFCLPQYPQQVPVAAKSSLMEAPGICREALSPAKLARCWLAMGCAAHQSNVLLIGFTRPRATNSPNPMGATTPTNTLPYYIIATLLGA